MSRNDKRKGGELEWDTHTRLGHKHKEVHNTKIKVCSLSSKRWLNLEHQAESIALETESMTYYSNTAL